MVAFLLFCFVGLPPIVKARAIKELSSRLGRPVTIERIRINPLVLSVTIEGFAIGDAAPGAGTFTGWRRLYVNFDSWSVLAGPPRFQEIALDGFTLSVAKGRDGGMNFDDIVAKLAADAAEEPPATEKSDGKARPPALAITKLTVSDARVSFDDASRERPFATVLGPLSFGLSDFKTVGDPDSPYQFEAVTSAGEKLAWKGTVSADPIKSRGELNLANIDLVRLSPYYHTLVKGELRSALVDFSGKYTFALNDAGQPVLTLADGAFMLRDFRFGAPGVAEDALALKRLAVTGIAADSATLRADIGKVSLEGVAVKITRDAEGIDLQRLVTPVTPVASVGASASSVPAPVAGAAARAMPTPVVTLGELLVAGVQAEATDLTTPRRAVHRVDDVRMSLRGLDSSRLDKLVPLTLEITLPQDGRVALSGDVAAVPLVADLDVALERVPFANASPYVEPFLNVRLVEGALRASGKATLREGVATFAGDFGIAGFRAVDGKLSQDFVKWTDFAIKGIKASSQPLAFAAEEIRFTEPTGAVRVEADGSLSIAQVGLKTVAAAEPAAEVTAVAPATAPSSPAPSPIAVSIGTFAFDNAAFRFEDRSIKPAARGGLTQFTGTITGLSSEALGRAEVDIRGKVDGVAPVAITGKLNPLGQPAFMDLKVDFQGIDLQPGAGPYVGKFAGRTLARGNLNVAVTAKLNDRKLDTNNVVTLDQFELGEKTNSPEATKLPVGLALALLRDTNGKIVIDLPVKGSLDDPSFKVGRVVVRVLVNILTKAATSPFSLLGAAFGGGGDELGWQEFGPGQATIEPAGLKKLETLAKALNGRPALSLDIVGAYDPDADLNALRLERLEQQVRATAWETRRLVDPNTPPAEQIEITPELRAGMLAKLYAAAFPGEMGDTAQQVPLENASTPVAPIPSAQTTTVAFPVPNESRVVYTREYGLGSTGRLRRYNARPADLATMTAQSQPAAVAEPSASETGVEMAVVPTLDPARMEARLAARIEISGAELQALGEARAQVIRTWLLDTGKVPAERVFLAPVVAKGTSVNLNLK